MCDNQRNMRNGFAIIKGMVTLPVGIITLEIVYDQHYGKKRDALDYVSNTS